jgi:hypothetical protein
VSFVRLLLRRFSHKVLNFTGTNRNKAIAQFELSNSSGTLFHETVTYFFDM